VIASDAHLVPDVAHVDRGHGFSIAATCWCGVRRSIVRLRGYSFPSAAIFM